MHSLAPLFALATGEAVLRAKHRHAMCAPGASPAVVWGFYRDLTISKVLSRTHMSHQPCAKHGSSWIPEKKKRSWVEHLLHKPSNAGFPSIVWIGAWSNLSVWDPIGQYWPRSLSFARPKDPKIMTITIHGHHHHGHYLLIGNNGVPWCSYGVAMVFLGFAPS